MIISLKVERRINMKNLFIFLTLCLLFSSCNKNRESSKSYYFKIYDTDNNVKGYFKRVIVSETNRRVDTIYRYDKNKELQNTRIEEVKSINKGIKINDENEYLTAAVDSCYNYKNDSSDNVEICYLGLSSLSINSSNYEDVFKFSVSELGVDGIAKDRYFDNNFILVREEFKEGLLDYYRIDRTDKIDGLK